MKLYYSPGACSLASHIVLREAGFAFEPVRVNMNGHVLPDGTDYYTLNPHGYVPLLELDTGEHLAEGQVILQYLADQAPTKNLAPANGTLARYRLQEWLGFIATEVHKNYSPLFNAALPEPAKDAFRSKLAKRLAWVEGQLDGKEFLTGPHFSVADAYLFVVLRWSGVTGVDLSALPHLRAYVERMQARPAVQAAIETESRS